MPYTCFRARVIPPVKLSLNLGELFGFFLLSVSFLLGVGKFNMTDELDALFLGFIQSTSDILSTLSRRPVKRRRSEKPLCTSSVAGKAIKIAYERLVGATMVVFVSANIAVVELSYSFADPTRSVNTLKKLGVVEPAYFF